MLGARGNKMTTTHAKSLQLTNYFRFAKYCQKLLNSRREPPVTRSFGKRTPAATKRIPRIDCVHHVNWGRNEWWLKTSQSREIWNSEQLETDRRWRRQGRVPSTCCARSRDKTYLKRQRSDHELLTLFELEFIYFFGLSIEGKIYREKTEFVWPKAERRTRLSTERISSGVFASDHKWKQMERSSSRYVIICDGVTDVW